MDHCNGEVCCQAVTAWGYRCTRQAKIQIDLTKDRSILGYKLPKVNCCFFCIQHAAIYTGLMSAKLSKIVAEAQLSWDDYLTLYPEYIDELKNE
jgi:hypothetical protein